MAPSSSSIMIMAGSAALLVAAAAARQLLPSSKKSRGTLDEIHEEEEDEEEMITADEVVKIFNRLFLEMQAVVAQLGQQVQALQMSGQQIPESELRLVLQREFERALIQRQAIVIEQEFQMDQDCLEQAVWEFINDEDNPQVIKAVERFQSLYENISGQATVGWRPGTTTMPQANNQHGNIQILSPEQTIGAAEIYFAALSAGMKELVDELKAEGKDFHNPQVAQELSVKFATVAEQIGEDALASQVISVKQFQASVQAHSTNPNVARSITMLQMKQQEDIMRMGVPANM